MDNILEKIRKLLALAANAGTPEEAASAAALAAKLMEAHQIEEAQIQIDAGAEKLTGYGHRPIPINNSQWAQYLISAVATANRCTTVFLKKLRDWNGNVLQSRIDIIGHRDDVAATIDTYNFLHARIDAMADVAFRTEGYGHGKAWKTSYRNGAVDVISRRFRTEARKREHNSSQSNALMVIENRVAEVTKELYPHLGTRRASARTSNSDGYMAGRRDGAGIGLSRPVNIGGGSGYLN